MKVIEYIEECILAARALKILDIVNDEDIDLHIECQEVSQLVTDICRIHILDLEPVGRHVKHHKFRIFLLYCNTDCLCKVCLAKTGTTEEEERILINPIVKEQYELVYGSWPTAANEIILVLDKNNDVAVYNDSLDERVLLAITDEIAEINELLVVLDVYTRELDLQAKDYEAILSENTALFIGAVKRMQTYLTYSEIKPIFDEAKGYYYVMNVESDEAKAAIEVYNYYSEMLNSIEVSSEMFKGHVARFAVLESAGVYDLSKIYEILSDCMTYAYAADLGVEGVSEAAEIFEAYLADYLAVAEAVNSGIADATAFVVSVRANMLIPTVLAVIGGIVNS